MKKVFSGYLTNDKECFVEIAFCHYSFKKDGKEMSIPYVTVFETSPTPNGIFVLRDANDLVQYVSSQQMCKTDVEKLIKGINKYPFDTIEMFSTEAESHLCERLREVAVDDEMAEFLKMFEVK